MLALKENKEDESGEESLSFWKIKFSECTQQKNVLQLEKDKCLSDYENLKILMGNKSGKTIEIIQQINCLIKDESSSKFKKIAAFVEELQNIFSNCLQAALPKIPLTERNIEYEKKIATMKESIKLMKNNMKELERINQQELEDLNKKRDKNEEELKFQIEKLKLDVTASQKEISILSVNGC